MEDRDRVFRRVRDALADLEALPDLRSLACALDAGEFLEGNGTSVVEAFAESVARSDPEDRDVNALVLYPYDHQSLLAVMLEWPGSGRSNVGRIVSLGERLVELAVLDTEQVCELQRSVRQYPGGSTGYSQD